MILVVIPIRTGSGLNERLHWAAKARKVKSERHATALAIRPQIRAAKGLHDDSKKVVKLTRISPRGRFLDDDNLRGSLKPTRDQVAAELGIDDGDTERIRFEYASERGPWGVRIEIMTSML